MKGWISKAILDWSAESSGGTVVQSGLRQRSYDHLARAEYFLKGGGAVASADRADCISNLRKCLTHRLQLLEKLYGLRRIAESGKSRPYLQILAEFGVVRPVLLERLLRVRNAIEYRDAQPPTVARCKEFVDLLWYFLRSTDAILSLQRTDIQLSPTPRENDPTFWCSPYVKYKPSLKLEISGWIPSELFFKSAVNEGIPFQGQFYTRGEKWPEQHLDKKETDIWLYGRVLPDRNARVGLVGLALTCIE